MKEENKYIVSPLNNLKLEGYEFNVQPTFTESEMKTIYKIINILENGSEVTVEMNNINQEKKDRPFIAQPSILPSS